MNPNDIALLITENPNISSNKISIYRSYPSREKFESAIKGLTKLSATVETYWSTSPIIYYTYKLSDGHFGNIIEAEISDEDLHLGGFGDGQPLYVFLTYPEKDTNWFKRTHSAKVAEIINKLPSNLVKKFKQVRQSIINDPEYSDDWTFAGLLPEKYKSIVISLISKAREHLSAFELIATLDEINYIGPISNIKSAVEFQFPEDIKDNGVPQIEHSINYRIYTGNPDYL